MTPNVGKPELLFMCSARRFVVFNVCMKFHETMSSGFKVMERTRKFFTEREREREREKRQNLYIPMAHFVCRV